MGRIFLIIILFPVFVHSKILLVGDSITEGQFSGKEAESWASIVGQNFEIINVGLGGTNSIQWSNKLLRQRAIKHLPADIVVLMLGTNGSVGFMREKPISPGEYSQAMNGITEMLIEAGAKKIMLMFPPKRFFAHPEINVRIQSYHTELKKIINTHKEVVEGPNFYHLLNKSHFEGEDIHPNAKGYKKMAEDIIKYLDRYIPKKCSHFFLPKQSLT